MSMDERERGGEETTKGCLQLLKNKYLYSYVTRKKRKRKNKRKKKKKRNEITT